MRWPFHIVFLGQGGPIWGYGLHNLTSKTESVQPQTASRVQESSISLKYAAVANPKFSAFHLAGSVETTDCIIRPEVMNMMVTDFKHTLTHAHFPKWSHFDGCTHSEPHTTPPGTHSGKHPHLTEAELELVLCWVTGCLKSQCKRETNI